MKKKLSALLLTAALVCVSAVPAFADNFTPSVTQKEAPKVVATKTADGTEVGAIIYDKDGNEVEGIPMDQIKVIPISSSEASDELKKANDEIKNAASLKDICPEVETTLAGITSDVKVEDLVVSDLFEVILPEEAQKKLEEDGNTLAIKFDLGAKQGELLMSMVNCDGTKWEMVDQKGINTNSDGTVNMTFDKFCPVAFIKDSAAVAVNPNGPASPQTSDINMTVVAAVAAMILVGACAAFVMTGKNRKAGF